jgi:Holliday junction resolvase
VSKASRNKGAVAEREVCRLLSEELGIEVRRNVDQARAGGADCLMVPGYAIEVKRREMLARPTWWKQACEQAQRVGMEPLVFYRRNREPWRALMTGMGEYRDVSWTEAMDVMRDKLARLYGVFKEAA